MLPSKSSTLPNPQITGVEQADASAIRQLILSGITADALSPMVDPVEVSRVSIDRVHFSDKRPPHFQLHVHNRSGSTQLLLAEYLGAAADSHARSEQASLRKSRRDQLQRTDELGVLSIPALGLVVRRPGLDVRLPGLRLLHHPDEAAALLARLNGSAAVPVSVSLVAHRLGKRAVMRVELETGHTLYLRLRVGRNSAARNAFSMHQLLHRRLAGQQRIMLPQPIGFDEHLSTAVFDTLPGQPLNLGADDAADRCQEIAHALLTLQSLRELPLPVHTARNEAALLHRLFSITGLIFPEIAAHLVDPLNRISSALDAEPTRDSVVCHRDLHSQQLLISNDGIGILDFDTVCLSSPVLDAGNLAAHLFLAGARGECQSEALEASLVAGIGSVQERRFQLWRASALLRLALMYCLTSEPQVVMTPLIDEVRQCCLK